MDYQNPYSVNGQTPKRKINKSAAALMVIGLFLQVSLPFAIVNNINSPGDPSNIKISGYVNVDDPYPETKDIRNPVVTARYRTVEESLLARPGIADGNGTDIVSNELFRLGDDDVIGVFTLGINKEREVGLLSNYIAKTSGEYSNVLRTDYIFSYPVFNSPPPFMMRYDLDHQVADTILNLIVLVKAGNLYYANNNQPTFVGITLRPEADTLTIGGKKPDKLMTAQYDGKSYYIWVYTGEDFAKTLLDDPDFNPGNCTLGQVIDILDIRYDKEPEQP